jgi:hypothetical protein
VYERYSVARVDVEKISAESSKKFFQAEHSSQIINSYSCLLRAKAFT